MLASIGVNGAMIALFLGFPTDPLEGAESAPDFIPVELVELPHEGAEPESKPETPLPIEAEQAPPPATGPAPASQTEPRSAIESPVIARADEAVEAEAMTGTHIEDTSEADLPVFAPPNARAKNALQALACARLGRERPAWCDDAADSHVIEVATRPAFAETPQIAPKEWADLNVPVQEKWCPEADGVIADVVVENDSPFLQGAGSMAGSLAISSAERC
ncbi:hypothetical protein [Henriciella barbarensis]|uniref:hypothetical protein n=1 Tax=Henriciella barbarensis TaxID=86342 RepID=UPI0011C40C66|nr:hypothetical protein [Henriciella barbarensis]